MDSLYMEGHEIRVKNKLSDCPMYLYKDGYIYFNYILLYSIVPCLSYEGKWFKVALVFGTPNPNSLHSNKIFYQEQIDCGRMYQNII